ncbi:F-box domain-containing protein [Entophlyctis helioformis]|nr:F-box domain-containing protein [Entophlyctis helioformis]
MSQAGDDKVQEEQLLPVQDTQLQSEQQQQEQQRMERRQDDKRVDLVTALPVELGIRILSFITTPKQLLRCGQVSRRWSQLAEDDSLWRDLCRTRWADKVDHPLELHPRVDYTNMADELSVREIKALLRRRKADMRGCIEKSDMVALLKRTTPASRRSATGGPSGRRRTLLPRLMRGVL